MDASEARPLDQNTTFGCSLELSIILSFYHVLQKYELEGGFWWYTNFDLGTLSLQSVSLDLKIQIRVWNLLETCWKLVSNGHYLSWTYDSALLIFWYFDQTWPDSMKNLWILPKLWDVSKNYFFSSSMRGWWIFSLTLEFFWNIGVPLIKTHNLHQDSGFSIYLLYILN